MDQRTLNQGTDLQGNRNQGSEAVGNTSLNKYSLVKVAARRARQLQSGAPPLSNSTSMKACRVAQDEIRAGYVGYVLPQTMVATELESTPAVRL